MKINSLIYTLVIFLIIGCKQKLVQFERHSAYYSKEFSGTKPKNFLVSVFISYDSLSKWMDERPNKTIFESKSDQSFIGFPIQTSLAGKIKLSSKSSNHLVIQAPAIFEAKPNVAGFNAGAVRGKLDFNLAVDLHLKSMNKLEVGNISHGYQWVEKPMVKVAGFGVNVSPVVDNLFKNKSREVNETIKTNLESLLEPASLEKMLVNYSKNIPWPEHTFPTSNVGLGIKKIDLSTQGLNLEVLLKASIGLGISQKNKINAVRYYLNQDQNFGRELPFSGQLDWSEVNELLTKLAKEKLKNQRLEIQISGEDSQYLRAQINGFKGPKSNLLLDFIPLVFDQHTLGFRIVHQELKGLSFPQSLFKNKAKKRINRLAADLKFDLMKSPEIKNQLSDSPVLKNISLSLEVLQWNETGFCLSGQMGADWKILK